uniref:INSC spindle orientation adaptor protein n=1 Tax=Astyanax mexicanus TaxID=7994 RepID=A0A8B9HUG6_ASTMX
MLCLLCLSVMHAIQVDSVQRWMEDLRHMTEVECMCVLQSKPIAVDEDSLGELIVSAVGTTGDHVTRDNLQTLLKRALVVSTELGKMFQRLERGRWQRVHSTAVRANCHVRSLVHEYSTARATPAHMQKVRGYLNPTATKNTLKYCAVVALLKICRQDCFNSLYAHALRTVASICCVEEGINQLEKVDGVLCLADILTDEGCAEAARAEAAAVVAQITSPQHTSTQHLASFLESMQDIVTALIKLCESASCGEVFLLASAALANITFFDSMACEILLQLNAVHILLQACRDRQRIDTPYSKDQVVTILANLSVLEQSASEVLQENGIERLLLLLGEKPSSSNPSEGAACERVQQKAAVTLARLSRDPDVAQAAIELQAVPRLIELCHSPAERNSSDSVLVACLAALRRLAAGCPDSIAPSDHQQLIKPRLVDSFLLCSNMEESFV